jgi:orotidine-5'-phosphate decarboxylase
MDHRDRLCVALDGSDRGWIIDMAGRLGSSVGWLKLGLEAFTACGPSLVTEVAALNPRVFLDVKLHDIPNTVERAAVNCAGSGAAMFNVHASGGRAMMEAARNGAARAAGETTPLVLAVTVLTSLDRHALAELGLTEHPDQLVIRWARLAQQVGLDGVVASAQEASLIRQACGEDFVIVTPGIRPAGSEIRDQRRVMSPAAAAAAGADILVVGRPVTTHPRPEEAAASILAELDLCG